MRLTFETNYSPLTYLSFRFGRVRACGLVTWVGGGIFPETSERRGVGEGFGGYLNPLPPRNGGV